MKSLLSIIVPIYNAEKYLHRCVDSLLAQTYSDIEVLLINDGSSDSSGAICDEYAQKDSRVRVFHKENSGVSNSRNLGIDKALGSWITFVDADDWFDVNTIATCKEYLTAYDLVRFSSSFVYDCHCLKVREIDIEDFTSVDEFFTALISRRTLIQVWGGFYRTDIIKQNKLYFDVELKNGEDWLFLMEYTLYATTIKSINLPLYYYNVYNESSCTNTMTVSKIFEVVSSFKKISEVLAGDERYRSSVFEGKISLMSFYILGIFLQGLSSRDLLYYREKLFNIVSSCPTFRDILSSKLPFSEKVLVLSVFNALSFVLFSYVTRLYKRLSKVIRKFM